MYNLIIFSKLLILDKNTTMILGQPFPFYCTKSKFKGFQFHKLYLGANWNFELEAANNINLKMKMTGELFTFLGYS
jgi:hypothetical protein